MLLSDGHVRLVPIDTSYVEYLSGIRNDWDNYDYFFDFGPVTPESELAWITKVVEDRSQANFIIRSAHSASAPIGTISLTSIDARSRHAEYGRLYVDPAERRGGMAMRASTLLLTYAFRELNLRRVYLRVFANNRHAIDLYKRLDFVEEGCLRQHVYKNGVYRDVLLMGLIERSESDRQKDLRNA